MAKPITALLSALAFALLGLLIGSLMLLAEMLPLYDIERRVVTGDDIWGTLVFPPIVGGVTGFVLSSFAIWLYGSAEAADHCPRTGDGPPHGGGGPASS